MNAYVQSVIENVRKKHGNEPGVCCRRRRIFSSILP